MLSNKVKELARKKGAAHYRIHFYPFTLTPSMKVTRKPRVFHFFDVEDREIGFMLADWWEPNWYSHGFAWEESKKKSPVYERWEF